MNNNWFEVSPKVGLGNLLNRSNKCWARLGNKDRQIKMGNSMTHFHLAGNMEYTFMINCSIYISWKTKFAILTILNGKTSKKKFSIDWQRVNSIFFTYWWKDTFGIHSLQNESKVKYGALRPDHLFIEFIFEIFFWSSCYGGH